MSKHDTTQKYENIVLVVFIIAFSFLFYVASTSESYSFDGIASMTFPMYIIGAVVVLCFIKLFRTYLTCKKHKPAIKEEEAPGTTVNGLTAKQASRKIMFTLLFIMVYALVWNLLGFALSTCLFIFLEAKFLKSSTSWLSCLIIGVGATVVLYFIFGFLFNVDFPEPILELLIG
ncbi:MAG: tripartite tricarboxylate transporter TctB family protein [Sphaerochaetaceae bacterium]|nr:tripartite tricarboxylate transporter TctB family protein [Sphaerochaetaceae bacterium]